MRRLTCTAIASLALAHPATAQISGDVVKIGVLTDMSGPFSDQTGRGSVAGAELAIEAGIDTIEHGFHLHERRDLLDRMASAGTVLVPTLDFLHQVAEAGSWTPELRDQGIGNLDHAQRTLDAARAAGVVIAAGSGGVTADGLAPDLSRRVEPGRAPTEAVRAATDGSASALGIDRVTGSLRAGDVADLVVTAGDPAADVAVLADPSQIALVMHNGTPVGGSLIDPPSAWRRRPGQAMTVAAPSAITGSSVA
jgi:imidazolonepropionase-like amidohydrolase